MYAARLASALKTRTHATIFGMGGDQMHAAGVDVITDYSEVSVLGITEILSHLPQLLRAMRKLVNAARDRKPELAVLTDFPGFHLRWRASLSRSACATSITSARSSGPGDLGAYASYGGDSRWRCVFFRSRKSSFGDAGVPVKFIGHPLVGNVVPSQTREQFLRAMDWTQRCQLVTILPGSRSSELVRHLSLLREACVKIHNAMPVQFVVAAAPAGPQALRESGQATSKSQSWKAKPTTRWLRQRQHRFERHRHSRAAAAGRPNGGGLSRHTTHRATGQAPGAHKALQHGEFDRRPRSRPGTHPGGFHARASGRADAASFA
jgi:hypothetical protein